MTGGEAASAAVPTIQASGVSKWFGHVVAVNDVSLRACTGITGLLETRTETPILPKSSLS